MLAPKKDAAEQSVVKSLLKLFKEEHIEYLLFDLVETNNDKEAADDLLKSMGLLPKKSNQVETQGFVN